MSGWRQSSKCDTSACVQQRWRKAKASVDTANCVEVAVGEEVSDVRDSKNPDAGYITVSRLSWLAFLTDICSGAYDLT